MKKRIFIIENEEYVPTSLVLKEVLQDWAKKDTFLKNNQFKITEFTNYEMAKKLIKKFPYLELLKVKEINNPQQTP